MNENIKIFLQKVSEDAALQAQLKACKSPDDAYELASSIQSGFTKDEFITVMKELKEKASRDLSDEDLEKAAGGGLSKVVKDTIQAITETVTAISAAAAA